MWFFMDLDMWMLNSYVKVCCALRTIKVHHDDNNMRLTALRLLEVRRAYASGQFDFGGMHDLAVAELTKENDRLMADYVKDSMNLPDAGLGEDGLNH